MVHHRAAGAGSRIVGKIRITIGPHRRTKAVSARGKPAFTVFSVPFKINPNAYGKYLADIRVSQSKIFEYCGLL